MRHFAKALGFLFACCAARVSAAETGLSDLLAGSGFSGGVVVHVGCGEGAGTVKLGQEGRWIVRGLDRDPGRVRAARERIAGAGLLGPVSAAQWSAGSLPFVESSVNVIIVDREAPVDVAQCKRALRPGGKVYFKADGAWQQVEKERPEATGEWTHALYDASGGSVSRDRVAGPPRRLQWTVGPKWTRHHEAVTSFQTMVSAAGRVFYLLDEGPMVSLLLPADWQLIARDAYNGKVLWKRPFKRWVSPLFEYKSGPTQMTRRLVAAGDRVFVAANLDEGVTVIDAASGRTLRVLENTAACEEILYYSGVLYLVTNDNPVTFQQGHRYSRNNAWAGQEKWIRAVNPETGEERWKLKTPIAPMSFAVSDRGVFFHDGGCIRALETGTGKERFKTEAVLLDRVIATATTPTLAVYQDVVLFWGGADQPEYRERDGAKASSSLQTFTAISAVDGRKLWGYKAPYHSTGFECPKDILVLDGLVWMGIMMGRKEAGTWTGRNLHTGEVERELRPRKDTYWFHQRCHRSKATERYIVSGRTGVEFISPKTGWESINHWVRGACMYGVMPANGLIYQPQHPCGCYMESLLTGFNALAPAGPPSDAGDRAPARLHRGPAYGRPVAAAPDSAGPPDEWPTFRHDQARSCSTASRIAPALTIRWRTEVGEHLSAVTVAGGKLFVADRDAHTLHGLDAATGKIAWRYLAGARIDSPPTLAAGRVLFGSRDGYLHCLDGADGELVWRYRVAPVERYLVAEEQLESAWPVHGSPLVVGDRVYCVGGRSAFLDGGLRMVCLDIQSGTKLHEAILDENDPTTGGTLMDKIRDRTLPVANPDILSWNGRNIFMNTQRFGMDCSRPEITATRDPSDQLGENAHLFVNSGFLDHSGFHRTLMFYGKSFSGGSIWNHRPARHAPAGKMLAFNDTHVFGFSRLPHLHRWVRALEWHVYRARKTERRPASRFGWSEPRPDPAESHTVIHTDSGEAEKLTQLRGSLNGSAVIFDWSNHDPDLYVNSMVLTPQSLYVAGPPAVRNEKGADALEKSQGKRGGRLWRLSVENGKRTAALQLRSPPVHEGLAAAYGKVFVSLKDGSVICLGGKGLDGRPAGEIKGRQ